MDKFTEFNISIWKEKLKDISPNDYKELINLDENTLNDSFYTLLKFGTGGLRGKMGLGLNRINKYTIYKSTRGLGNYLNSKFNNPSVVIGYDSRNHSKEFAFLAANIFTSLGIKVYIFSELIPTPVVSYAIRKLNLTCGVIITASHNPKEYNGYKVYNKDANQITLEEASLIESEINKIDPLDEFTKYSKESEFTSLINIIDESLIKDYIKSTIKAVNPIKEKKDIKIIYTPLNGAGYKLVPIVLKECGFNNLTIVKEQSYPDGNFETCPKPNPELKEAMQYGIDLLNLTNSDLLIATDPDCDRCGVALKINNEIKLLNGNEVAIIIINYLLKVRDDLDNKEIIRSIVSTSFIDKLAKEKNINVKTVLTGFKYIGEEMNNLEKENNLDKFLFGFEESYGYLSNNEIRDKDGVNASLLIAEIANYYLKNNSLLIEELEKVYKEHGYNKTHLLSIDLEGSQGVTKINNIVSKLREMSFDELNLLFKSNVLFIEDYLNSVRYSKNNKEIINLPKSNVLIFILDDGTRFMIRPSGTEPKIKCYIEVNDNRKDNCDLKINKYSKIFNSLVN